jgi:hypothetical protein
MAQGPKAFKMPCYCSSNTSPREPLTLFLDYLALYGSLVELTPPMSCRTNDTTPSPARPSEAPAGGVVEEKKEATDDFGDLEVPEAPGTKGNKPLLKPSEPRSTDPSTMDESRQPLEISSSSSSSGRAFIPRRRPRRGPPPPKTTLAAALMLVGGIVSTYIRTALVESRSRKGVCVELRSDKSA